MTLSGRYKPASSTPGAFQRAGKSTPHSQLRQLSLGPFVALSLTSLPQAASEQFAEPTYAQDLDGSSSVRTNSICDD